MDKEAGYPEGDSLSEHMSTVTGDGRRREDLKRDQGGTTV